MLSTGLVPKEYQLVLLLFIIMILSLLQTSIEPPPWQKIKESRAGGP